MKGVYNGVSLPNNGPNVSLLQYADDAIFLGEWSWFNIRNLNRILHCFHLSSGLKVNLQKSSIFGTNIASHELESMARRCNCKVGSLPFTYLGIPIGVNMNKACHWDPILKKFRSKLSMWKAHSLSVGGWLVLCKSVLGSLSLYYFSLFKAPKKVIQKLESIRMQFFWGMQESSRKIAWVAWDKVLNTVENGGLGIGSLRAKNISLLTNWQWKLMSQEDALWKRIIQSLHGHDGGILSKSVFGKFPGVWRNILRSMVDLEALNIPLCGLFQRQVSVHSDLKFWCDPWLLNVPLKEVFPNLYCLEKKKKCSIRERLVQDGCRLAGYNPNWKHSPSSIVELNEWRSLYNECLNFRFVGSCDKWKWVLDNTGEFSSSSLRAMIDDFSLPKAPNIGFKWISLVPGKVNILMWRFLHRRLATLSNLRKRGIGVDSAICPCCSLCDETEEHIISGCLASKEVISSFCKWWKISNPPKDINEILDWCRRLNLKGIKEAIFLATLYSLVWIIWNARNQKVFSSVLVSHCDVQAESFFWVSNRGNKKWRWSWNVWCNDPFLIL